MHDETSQEHGSKESSGKEKSFKKLKQVIVRALVPIILGATAIYAAENRPAELPQTVETTPTPIPQATPETQTQKNEKPRYSEELEHLQRICQDLDENSLTSLENLLQSSQRGEIKLGTEEWPLELQITVRDRALITGSDKTGISFYDTFKISFFDGKIKIQDGRLLKYAMKGEDIPSDFQEIRTIEELLQFLRSQNFSEKTMKSNFSQGIYGVYELSPEQKQQFQSYAQQMLASLSPEEAKKLPYPISGMADVFGENLWTDAVKDRIDSQPNGGNPWDVSTAKTATPEYRLEVKGSADGVSVTFTVNPPNYDGMTAAVSINRLGAGSRNGSFTGDIDQDAIPAARPGLELATVYKPAEKNWSSLGYVAIYTPWYDTHHEPNSVRETLLPLPENTLPQLREILAETISPEAQGS